MHQSPRCGIVRCHPPFLNQHLSIPNNLVTNPILIPGWLPNYAICESKEP